VDATSTNGFMSLDNYRKELILTGKCSLLEYNKLTEQMEVRICITSHRTFDVRTLFDSGLSRGLGQLAPGLSLRPWLMTCIH